MADAHALNLNFVQFAIFKKCYQKQSVTFVQNALQPVPIIYGSCIDKFFEFANAYKYSKIFVLLRIYRQKYDEHLA